MEDEFEQFRARAYGRYLNNDQTNNNNNNNNNTTSDATNEDTTKRRTSHPRRHRLQPAATEIYTNYYTNDYENDQSTGSSTSGNKMRRHSAMGIAAADHSSRLIQQRQLQQKQQRHQPQRFLPLTENTLLPVAAMPDSTILTVTNGDCEANVGTPFCGGYNKQSSQASLSLKSRESSVRFSFEGDLEKCVEDVEERNGDYEDDDENYHNNNNQSNFTDVCHGNERHWRHNQASSLLSSPLSSATTNLTSSTHKLPSSSSQKQLQPNSNAQTQLTVASPKNQRRSSTCGVFEQPTTSTLSPRGSARNLAISPKPTNRRNSCMVGASKLKPTLSPPNFLTANSGNAPVHNNSSRRNSAITYLTDGTSPSKSRVSLVALATQNSRSGDFISKISSDSSPSAWKRQQNLLGDRVKESSFESEECNQEVLNDRTECDSPETLVAAAVYKILVVGANGVGKTTLIRQLLTSEYLANQSGSDQDLNATEKTSADVRLDDEDCTVSFTEWHTLNYDLLDETDSCLLVYSVNDRSSFNHASICLTDVRKRFESNRMFVGLVANKQDLVRNRLVSTKEGKKLALKRHCKFLEVSALLDHKVDRLLVSTIRGTRNRRTKLNMIGTEIIIEKSSQLRRKNRLGKFWQRRSDGWATGDGDCTADDDDDDDDDECGEDSGVGGFVGKNCFDRLVRSIRKCLDA